MCVSPYIVQKSDGSYVPVPCGKCIECLNRYKNDWIFRIKQECKGLVCPIKVELTYAPEFLPVAYNNEVCEWQSYVSKREVQLFLKRLRKACPEFKNNLRYFAVGEYGRDGNRAHYHLILMSSCIRTSHQYYKKLLTCWNKGFIYIEKIDLSQGDKQLAYVTGYLNKIDKSPHIVPPFRLMSKSLGLNYLTDRMVEYYFTTFNTGVHDNTGWHKMPRYYRKKLDEYSSRHPFLKDADLKFSDVIAFGDFKAKGLGVYFNDFCKHFDEYYRKIYRDEVRLARINGYSLPDRPFKTNEVFRKFCSRIKPILDAQHSSDEAIRRISVKHHCTRLYESDLRKVFPD